MFFHNPWKQKDILVGLEVEKSTKTSLGQRKKSLIQLIYRFWMSTDSSLSASANQVIIQSIELRIKTLCQSPRTSQCPQFHLETHWQLMSEIRRLAYSMVYDTLIDKWTATEYSIEILYYSSKTQTITAPLPWSQTAKHLCQCLP